MPANGFSPQAPFSNFIKSTASSVASIGSASNDLVVTKNMSSVPLSGDRLLKSNFHAFTTLPLHY